MSARHYQKSPQETFELLTILFTMKGQQQGSALFS